MRIRTEVRTITATKGDNTVRLVPLANYGVYISLKAITSKDATDTETLLPINRLTIQPQRHTCGFRDMSTIP